MDQPSIQPNSPWLLIASVRGGGERALLVFKCPEEQGVVGMPCSVNGDITSPVTR